MKSRKVKGKILPKDTYRVADLTTTKKIPLTKNQIYLGALAHYGKTWSENKKGKFQNSEKINVQVKKPDTQSHVRENSNEEVTNTYCSIKNLPQKRLDAIRMAMLFGFNLEQKNFLKNEVYDEKGYGNEIIDYRPLLLDHAEKWGTKMYFYQPITSDDTVASQMGFDRFEKELSLSAMELLVGSDRLGFFARIATDNIRFFRKKILGWQIEKGVSEGNSVGGFDTTADKVGLIAVLGSTIAPENIAFSVSKLNKFKELTSIIWSSDITAKNNQINAAISAETNKREEIYAKYDFDDSALVALNSILRIEKLGKAEDSIEFKDEDGLDVYFHWKANKWEGVFSGWHISPTRYEKMGNDIGRMDRQDMDLLYNYIAVDDINPFKAIQDDPDLDLSVFLKKTENAIKEMRQRIQKLANYATDFFNEEVYRNSGGWDEKFYRMILNRRVVKVFEAYKNFVLGDGSQLTGEDSKVVKEVALTLENLSDQQLRLEKLKKEVSSGLFYTRFTEYVGAIFIKNNEDQKVVSSNQSILSLVLTEKKGSYQEIPTQKWILNKLSPDRAANFLDPQPKVGLLKEYSFELQHKGFGVGRHLHSQALFPGEELEMEVKNVKKVTTEITENSAEKIFEGNGRETQEDFNKELQDELNKSRSNASNESASVSASASFFSAKVDASYNWSASTEENKASKAISKTTNKLANKLSDKREISIETTTNTKNLIELEETASKKRKFQNINKERTLTFNFFQVTRKYETRFNLDDIMFYYTSGAHNIVKIFANVGFFDAVAQNTEEREEINKALVELSKQYGLTGDDALDLETLEEEGLFEQIPLELANRYPEDTLIFILSEPFQHYLPLGLTNSFLASTFDEDMAKEINKAIWFYIGGGVLSPEGLGVGAFPKAVTELNEMGMEIQTDGAESPRIELTIGTTQKQVIADEIFITNTKKQYKLANIDLRYAMVNGYQERFIKSDDLPLGCLPVLINRDHHIINTDGVYTENMLGQCGALEEFATDHRRLDVEAKETANQHAKRMLPPAIEDFKQEDGSIDKEAYNDAVAAFVKITEAVKLEYKDNITENQ